MIGDAIRLRRDRRGSAAAEMALVLPLLLTILFGSLELGNYFMNEHTLIKAVRDGARFAARQGFVNYTGCNTGDLATAVVTSTKNVVMNGAVSGGSIITPNINAGDITVSTSCMVTTPGIDGQTMTGIYTGRVGGAQIVQVSARVDYRPIMASAFGFSGAGLTLNAASQAAVAGN